MGENLQKRNNRAMSEMLYTRLAASTSGPALVRRLPDGAECVLTVTAVLLLPDAFVLATALRDPDAQPITPDSLTRMRRKPRGETLRRLLDTAVEKE